MVIRTPARTFWTIWLDETATTIPRIPSDATKAVGSKARRCRALA